MTRTRCLLDRERMALAASDDRLLATELVAEHHDVEARLEADRPELVALDRRVAVAHETDRDLTGKRVECVDHSGEWREVGRRVSPEGGEQWCERDVVAPHPRESSIDDRTAIASLSADIAKRASKADGFDLLRLRRRDDRVPRAAQPGGLRVEGVVEIEERRPEHVASFRSRLR